MLFLLFASCCAAGFLSLVGTLSLLEAALTPRVRTSVAHVVLGVAMLAAGGLILWRAISAANAITPCS